MARSSRLLMSGEFPRVVGTWMETWGGLPNLWDKTAPAPVLDASPSTTKGRLGFGRGECCGCKGLLEQVKGCFCLVTPLEGLQLGSEEGSQGHRY